MGSQAVIINYLMTACTINLRVVTVIKIFGFYICSNRHLLLLIHKHKFIQNFLYFWFDNPKQWLFLFVNNHLSTYSSSLTKSKKN